MIPSVLHITIIIALLTSMTLARLNTFIEPGTEHVSGRGFCVEYNIPANSLLQGYFEVDPSGVTPSASNPSPPRVMVSIYDGANDVPFTKQDVVGKVNFSFRTRDVAMVHQFCFRLGARRGGSTSLPKDSRYQVALEANFNLDLFDSKLAIDSKMKPVEADFIIGQEEFRRLSNDLADLEANEALMRSVNEQTYVLITRFSVVSILVLIGVGAYQVWYLRRFFRTKKLI